MAISSKKVNAKQSFPLSWLTKALKIKNKSLMCPERLNEIWSLLPPTDLMLNCYLLDSETPASWAIWCIWSMNAPWSLLCHVFLHVISLLSRKVFTTLSLSYLVPNTLSYLYSIKSVDMIVRCNIWNNLFYFEIIVDSHEVLRNSTEIFCPPSPLVPSNGNLCHNYSIRS